MKHRDKFFTLCLLGAFAVSLPAASAQDNPSKRIYASPTETKVDIGQPAHARNAQTTSISMNGNASGQRGTLSDRIQAILHPPVPEEPPAKPERPKAKPPVQNADVSTILGSPTATEEQCVKYLLSVNPHPNIAVPPEELVAYYYEEGEREGVRPDVAFAQALKETGYFRYGGTVTPDQNNYCGLGTTSAHVKGAYFPSSLLGVRAHIQHLLAYASTKRPNEEIVDPRYDLVRAAYGQSTLDCWEDLNGRWAVPGTTYGQSIMQLFNAILRQ